MCYCLLPCFPYRTRTARVEREPVEQHRGVAQYVAPSGRRYSSRWNVETTVGGVSILLSFHLSTCVLANSRGGGGGGPLTYTGKQRTGSPGNHWQTRPLFELFASKRQLVSALRPLEYLSSCKPFCTNFFRFPFSPSCVRSPGSLLGHARVDFLPLALSSSHSRTHQPSLINFLPSFSGHWIKILPPALEGQHSTPQHALT